ncbi:MAG: AAA family ATPase [Acidobacteriota bacterium]
MSEPSSQSSGEQSGGNPYVGPRAFRTGELLFGRDREVRELLSMLIADRIVLLYSPSGAGKTSLIQARLVKALEEEDLRVLPLLRVSSAPRPEDAELCQGANRYLLGTLLSLDPDRRIPVAELVRLGLDGLLERFAEESQDDRPQVLVFDQFEEILTLDPADQESKRKFFEEAGAALRNPQRWALFSMREDYIGALEPYVGHLPSRLRTMFRLDLLSPAAASLAIREPARSRKVDFKKAAADLLIDDLRTMLVQGPDGTAEKKSGPFIEPVQLQVVCHRLWSRLPEGATAIEADQIDPKGGDVDAALAEYYAEWAGRIAQGDETRERLVRDWFENALITEHGTRGQVLLTPGESQGLDNETIQSLVKEAHLVRAEARRGATWFELAHDRLIGPVKAGNAEWRETHLDEFQRRALAWGERGLYPEALLLRGKSLEEAEAGTGTRTLTDLEKDFLEASRKAREEAEKEQELRRAGEELVWQRRQARRLAAFMVVALALAAFATYSYIQARAETKRANQETERANQEAKRAGKAEQLARQKIEQLQATNDKLTLASAKLLEQSEQLGTSAPVEQVAAAKELLAQTGGEDVGIPALSTPVRVQFFARSSGRNDRAMAALRKQGFEVEPEKGRSTVVNAVWYGPGVEAESVQQVILTLIGSGVEIQRVAPTSKPGLIQVGTDERWLYRDALTVDQVAALQPCSSEEDLACSGALSVPPGGNSRPRCRNIVAYAQPASANPGRVYWLRITAGGRPFECKDLMSGQGCTFSFRGRKWTATLGAVDSAGAAADVRFAPVCE